MKIHSTVQPNRKMHSSTSKNTKLKLPPQLLSIIQGEEKSLCEQGFLPGVSGAEEVQNVDERSESLMEKQAHGTESLPSESFKEGQDHGTESLLLRSEGTKVTMRSMDLMNIMLARSAACEEMETLNLEDEPGISSTNSLSTHSHAGSKRKKTSANEPSAAASCKPPPHTHQHQQQHSVTQIVLASQSRFTKELCSYTRAVCMRLGYDS